MFRLVIDRDDLPETTRTINAMHNPAGQWGVMHVPSASATAFYGEVLRGIGRPPPLDVPAKEVRRRAEAWAVELSGWNLVIYGAWRLRPATAAWLSQHLAGHENTVWLVTHNKLKPETRHQLETLTDRPSGHVVDLLGANTKVAGGTHRPQAEVSREEIVMAGLGPWPWGLRQALHEAPEVVIELHQLAEHRVIDCRRPIDYARLLFALMSQVPNGLRAVVALCVEDAALRAGWTCVLHPDALRLQLAPVATPDPSDPFAVAIALAVRSGAGVDFSCLAADTAGWVDEAGAEVKLDSNEAHALRTARRLQLERPTSRRAAPLRAAGDDLSVASLLRYLDCVSLRTHVRWTERPPSGPAWRLPAVPVSIRPRALQWSELLLVALLHSHALSRRPLEWSPDDELALATLQRMGLVVTERGMPQLAGWLRNWLVDHQLS